MKDIGNSHLGIFLDKVIYSNKYIDKSYIDHDSWISSDLLELSSEGDYNNIIKFLKTNDTNDTESSDSKGEQDFLSPNKKDFINEVYDIENKKIKNMYKKIKNKKLITISLNLSKKIIVGFGDSTIGNFSLSIHHFYGIPYIPASTIKGAILNYIQINYEDKKNYFEDIIFFDAFGKGYKLTEDLLLNTKESYYKEGIVNINNELESGVPVFFLSIEEGSFNFNFLIDKNIKNELEVQKLIKESLCVFGLGGRTNVGYGHFEEKINIESKSKSCIYKIEKSIIETKGAKGNKNTDKDSKSKNENNKDKNEDNIKKEIRLTSLKGWMRKWWRCLFAYEKGNNISTTKQLLEREKQIFGDIDNYSSPFGLRIVNGDETYVYIEIYMKRNNAEKNIKYYKELFEATLFLQKGYVSEGTKKVNDIFWSIVRKNNTFNIEFKKSKGYNFSLENNNIRDKNLSAVQVIRSNKPYRNKKLNKKRLEDKKYVYYEKIYNNKKYLEEGYLEVEFNFLPKRKEKK